MNFSECSGQLDFLGSLSTREEKIKANRRSYQKAIRLNRSRCSACQAHPTDHRSGLCSACRKRTCASCRGTFIPKNPNLRRCGSCESAYLKRLKTYAHE